MGRRQQDFFKKDSFAVMGNTRRMRDAVNGLKEMGKTVYFVDAGFSKDESAGKFPSLADIPGPVDAAICDGRFKVKSYVGAVADAGIKSIWFNFLSNPRDAVALAREKDLDVWQGECAVVWLPTRGPHHSMHRLLWKLLGKY